MKSTGAGAERSKQYHAAGILVYHGRHAIGRIAEDDDGSHAFGADGCHLGTFPTRRAATFAITSGGAQ